MSSDEWIWEAMEKAPKPQLRIDASFNQSPEMISLTAAEFRVAVEAICWCARYPKHQGEGDVPDSVLRSVVRCPPAMARSLESKGFWGRGTIDGKPGWRIARFTDWVEPVYAVAPFEARRSIADAMVYLIRRVGGGPTKIGLATDPVARLRGLQTSSPERLEIVASGPGGFALERELHERFAHRRLSGEWFALDDAERAEARALLEGG